MYKGIRPTFPENLEYWASPFTLPLGLLLGSLAYICGLEKDDPGGPSLICDVDIATMTLQTFPLPEDGRASSLAWSADGKSFLFEWGKGYPEPQAIWRLDIATRQLSTLSQLPVGVSIESWSPDRSRVAFITSGKLVSGPQNAWWEGRSLYIQNVDGTSRRMIYENVVGDVVWSPDGETIAFIADSEHSHLCWMPIEGSAATCLKESGGSLAWSPDGKRIAFSYGGIHVVDTQTQVVQTLIRAGEEAMYDLSWSPDGEYLAYDVCCCMKPNEGCEVYVVSSDGKQHRQLTRNRVADEFPVWQPVTPASRPNN
jgi:Tol biopolymer transport system component